jgi:hypothetical protein
MRTKETKIVNNPNFSFLVLFLFLFFYYLLVFNSYLYYHNHQPIFLLDKTYLKEFLLYPGGPSELIAEFFLQFFYFNLFGAFFISTLSVSIFIIIYKIIKKIGDFKYSLILSFLPVSFLLIIQNHYNYPLMLTFKYLFALIFFLAYVKIPQRYKVFFILLSCLIYYILGGWIYLFYVVLCVAHELFFSEHSRKYIYAVLNLLVYFIYPYIAVRYLFMIYFKDAYLYIMPDRLYGWPFNFKCDLYCYLFFLSLPVLLIALFVYLKDIEAEIKKRKGKKRKIKKRKSSLAGTYRTLIQSISIILAAVLILTFSFDRQEKKKVQIDYLAQQGRWEELLNLALETEEYDILVNFNVNRALYHTGKLLDDLFGYPQMMGADGSFLENIPRYAAIPATDLYFDLGHVRAAEVIAYEGQTNFVYHPRMLKMIVVTNIIEGKYGVAKKFLDLLNKSILHKKWVRHYRSYLFDKSLIESDSLIQLKRKLMPKSDFFIAISDRADKNLIELLKEDENNKMAFEYLMAYYLLEFWSEDLLEHLDKFKKLGYKKYPRHIEEALLSIGLIDTSKKVKFDYSISQQTVDRFEQFNSIISRFGNEERAREVLHRGFFHTYWYYVFYIKPEETNLE